MIEHEFLSVHDAHCCQNHGCKYGDDDCPVEAGKEPGIRCEDCYNEPEPVMYQYRSKSSGNWFECTKEVFELHKKGKVEVRSLVVSAYYKPKEEDGAKAT